MKQSHLFTKTRKESPKDEVSKNADILIRAGFIHKEMAGVYTILPLGLRVLEKIETIIREEMNAVGGQEMKLTALQDKDVWKKSGRWDDEVVDNWFKTKLKNDTELGLGFTHEEPIANAMVPFINSYKDLPRYAYQIQTKFRNESRAKAGLMRGREFSMKDLYSFSKDEAEHNLFYEKMKDVYMNVFTRIGIGEQTFITASSGEPFSKYSFEFQTISEAGEDTIVIDDTKKIAINKDDYTDEIINDLPELEEFNVDREETSIEVGDIYSLGTKYSEAEGLMYKDEEGKEHPVFMGSYGMSPTRLMGTVVEVHADNSKGLVWPKNISPFTAHVLNISPDDNATTTYANSLVTTLEKNGIDVLYDDRDARAGEKFSDADLIGIPNRIIISQKNVEKGEIEFVDRVSGETQYLSEDDLIAELKK